LSREKWENLDVEYKDKEEIFYIPENKRNSDRSVGLNAEIVKKSQKTEKIGESLVKVLN